MWMLGWKVDYFDEGFILWGYDEIVLLLKFVIIGELVKLDLLMLC